jgi:phage terminase large subunit GpA-like protein
MMNEIEIPKTQVDGERLAIEAILAGLKPDPVEPMSKWADEYRILNQTYAAESGKWRTSRTPYLREIMDAFSPSNRCEFVTIMKGAQLGFTEALTNMIGYIVHRAPAPVMMVQPTQNLAKRYSKQRLATMISDMPVLKGLVADPRARDSGNTTTSKAFDGGVMFIAGANSAADLRSVPVRYLLLDEVDAYPYDVDNEGDPIELAVNRTKTFARRKVLIGSTPTVKDVSRVEREFLKADQRKYHVPCPHCKTMDELIFTNIKWDKDENKQHLPETAYYACPHCAGVIDESFKTEMLAAGKWVATKPENNVRDKRRSYHISSLYSPWETWASMVQKFLEAQADPHLLKTFINTALGECWDEEANRVDMHDLQKTAEPYSLRVLPMGALVVTCGVDVQDNRLEAVIWAYGKGEESWVIDYQIFFGDPASDDLWEELDEYLEKEIQHTSGSVVKISAVAIDTGGHHTQKVYDFCRLRKHRHVIAIKGQSTRNRPVIGRPTNQDISMRGKTIKGGVQLWPVGTDTAKGVLYGRFGIESGAAGSIHFSKDLPDEFYAQITAEKLITRYHKGHPIQEWVKPSHKRNEVLDCTVYALAAAYHLGMNKFSERDWSRLEEIVQPITADLFENNVQKLDEKGKKPAKTGEKTHKVKKKTAQNPRRKRKSAGFVARY